MKNPKKIKIYKKTEKTWGAEAPHVPHFSRICPIMTCTYWQVGCRSISLLLPTSACTQRWAGGLQTKWKLTSQ